MLVAPACSGGDRTRSALPDAESPRLAARPASTVPSGRCAPGEHELRIASGRRALMRVSKQIGGPGRALLVALHGAGSGGAPGGLFAFRGAWNVPDLVIVAPAAAGSGWSSGATDVHSVDRALRAAFARCRIDPHRVAIGGFSSGAGMTLWLGLANGDLFRSLLVFSGGDSFPTARVGKPRVFVAHGTLDGVIPISLGGDRIVRELRADGYDVTYKRFRGGHRVVPSIARAIVGEVAGT
jgi:phospholipase/carboxylesterase